MKVFANLFYIFVFGPLLMIESGWAISTAWGWFIAPLGAPQLGIAQAIGLRLTLQLIAIKAIRRDKEEGIKQLYERALGVAIAMPIGVGLGWIVKQFV